ncbi:MULTISPECIES: HEAT repeat domain-containing protein [unclassified Psychrobacter]|uniref:HEAT repeat domain-containing protein n=1 Tax=unclassified Psychrobacter TaxID=196806 RepID=UPI0025B2F723|nr:MULTISPECIES: HEAT repeat domain-containing protein [unclassified Psychrobacter]MDN3453122.1 HEAT repeat domain-containing protein [Psychrobacter sp. APC 3350]MDN3501921.1 HEAT repeat domain-containing protein [Psychrobacter sp. 5A.1]
MKTITLPYWGQIIGMVSTTKAPKTLKQDSRSLFITRQPQISAAVLYILDDKDGQFSLSTTTLPCPMQAITTVNDTVDGNSISNSVDNNTVVMIGGDGHLYQTDWQAKKIKSVSSVSVLASMSNADQQTGDDNHNDSHQSAVAHAVAIAPLKHAIAILYPRHIVVWPYQNNTTANNIVVVPYESSGENSAPVPTTALATSSDGHWLVVGDKLGAISSYQWTGSDITPAELSTEQLTLSSQKQIHQGKVESLCFEPLSQYFFSAGADNGLYRTHVQGDLHPVDRAKSSQHSQKITAMCVSGSRLFTAADDKSVKSWAFDKGQPNTCKEDLSKAHQLILSRYADKPALMMVGSDQSLRIMPIEDDKSGKLLPVACIIKDGYHRVSQLLTDKSNQNDVAFEEGLALLHAKADNQTLEIVKRLLADKNNTISASQALQLVQWVASTALDKTKSVLEQQLNTPRSAKVRLTAFHALAAQSRTTARPLQYLEQAIKSNYEEVVASALQGYLQAALSHTDQQRRILPVFKTALAHNLPTIRKQALASLEVLFPEDEAQAALIALDSDYADDADIIQAALIRLYQRGMLASHEVTRQLTRLQNHQNQSVRQTAFYVSILSQPKLVEVLKKSAQQQGDTQLIRTLTDFDDFKLLRGTLLDNASHHNKNETAADQKNTLLNATIDGLTEEPVAPAASSKHAIHLDLSTQDFMAQTDDKRTDAATKKPTAKTKASINISSASLSSTNLNNDDLEPLLQSLGNTHKDISFRAAYALACLQDSRAFGSLVRLISHNDDAVIRAGVATALGNLALEDAKAVLPALLDDKDTGVRQVAMQAFGKLTDDALSWAAIGFASKYQDIHEQSLAIFLTQVGPSQSNIQTKGQANKRATNPSTAKNNNADDAQMPSEMTAILLQALNNPFTSIRLEVVKVLLNRQLANAASTAITDIISLLQQSLFEDVHQVAIEEWQRTLLTLASKQKTDTQGAVNHQNLNQAVLTLFFADTFTAIRKQAFDIALKQSKHLGFVDVVLGALASPYADIKNLALTTIHKKSTVNQLPSLMPALIGLLADDSIALRKQALNVALALTGLQLTSVVNEPSADDKGIRTNEASHYETLITSALNSPYPDIQLTVAQMLATQSRRYADEQQAQHNDDQAYKVFKHYLDAPMPSLANNSDSYTQWHNHVSQALFGLARLAYPSRYDALGWYAKYLHHPDANFKQLAPKLTQIVCLDDIDLLAKWQTDENSLISQSASLCLAILGDVRGRHFLTHNMREGTDNINTLVAPMTPVHWLQAQHGLSITHAQQLQPLFESESYAVAARLLLIFNDLQNDKQDTAAETVALSTIGRPNRLIEALSFADNETAVLYANILARYPNHTPHADGQPALSSAWQYLSDALTRQLSTVLSNHASVITMLANAMPKNTAIKDTAVKGDNKAPSHSTTSVRVAVLTTVSTATLQQLATLSHHHQPLVRAQTINVICHLSELLAHDYYDDEDDVLATLQKWQRSLQVLLSAHPIPASIHDVASADDAKGAISYPYQTLAFGTWLGVIRAGDGYYDSGNTTDQAIRGLMWLALSSSDKNDAENAGNNDVSINDTNNYHWKDSASRVLLPLLNHRGFDTRELAWDSLCQLNVATQKLAEYAMSTPYRDMVKRGLDLLLSSTEAESASTDVANQHLIGLLKTNNVILAEETYQRLKERLGHLPASLLGLQAYSALLRYQSVVEWRQVAISPFAHSPSTLRQDKLRFLEQAIKSEDWNTRYQAFMQLTDFYEVVFSDSTVFDELFEFLADGQSEREQNRALQCIIQALQSYPRIQGVTHSINHGTSSDDQQHKPSSDFDDKQASSVVGAAYERLLGLLDDPQLKLPKSEIYDGIAELRDVRLVATLLARLQHRFDYLPHEHKRERQQIFDTLVTISGYDQSIHDYLDEKADERWLQRQYPRHPQVLLSLFVTLMGHSDYDHAAQLLPSLSWAKATATADMTVESISTRIDTALTLAYQQLPAQYTVKLVQALAYRAKRRHGSLVVLHQALSNKDADVQWFAAEGLASCGRAEGLTILMATIDYNPDGELRRRSVLAIGELLGNSNNQNTHSPNASSPVDNADKNLQVHTLYKAYDKLIKLAEDDEHYLQDVASEALGRLAQGGDFEHSPHIFELLKSHLSDPAIHFTNPGIVHWLNGLRWLNTTPAWEQIRHYIRIHLDKAIFFRPQRHAVWLLQMNDSDANQALMLDILKTSNLDCAVLMAAYTAAQKTWGSLASQVYPYDWAAIQSHNNDFIEETEHLSLKRIIDNSSIDELAAFITQHGTHLPSDILMALQNAIMAKQDMPTSQLTALITSNNTLTQHIGLSYLTQYPTEHLDTDMMVTLQHCLDNAKQQWQALITVIDQSPTSISDSQWRERIEQVSGTIKQLIWLVMRHFSLPNATAAENTSNLQKIVTTLERLSKFSLSNATTTENASNFQKISTTLEWLSKAHHSSMVISVPLLSAIVNDWWQQALLALLARPHCDDALLANIEPLLRAMSTTQQPPESRPLQHDSQTLLLALINRIAAQASTNTSNISAESSSTLSINQQLLLWIREHNAAALYDCASSATTDEMVKVRAIEALGQLTDPRIEQWLHALMTQADDDTQKLAYKVLRRWQRGMIRAQQKRPSSSIAAQNSQDSSQKSNQGEGDSQ